MKHLLVAFAMMVSLISPTFADSKPLYEDTAIGFVFDHDADKQSLKADVDQQASVSVSEDLEWQQSLGQEQQQLESEFAFVIHEDIKNSIREDLEIYGCV
ncbi:hypothetical protein KFE80_12350 [bacterium SCSIO 12696]|nr:hypothetical protein KFE80_12350 [bacterium SCSIO 12696]